MCSRHSRHGMWMPARNGCCAAVWKSCPICDIDAVYNYPTLPEYDKYASYDGLGALRRHAQGECS